MIITIDGYDGTGKTTLARKLSTSNDYIYLDKPFIKKIQYQKGCSFEEAQKISQLIERKLFSSCSNKEIAIFYCDALIWLKRYEKKFNIILDRGLLTTYAVVGNSETIEIFEEYVRQGAFFTASFYLKATDEERVRRIYKNNPNDPDLKYPTKWRKNDLEEFVSRMNLNCYKIDTNGKTPDEVFKQVSVFFEKELQQGGSDCKIKKFTKIKK